MHPEGFELGKLTLKADQEKWFDVDSDGAEGSQQHMHAD
jgi:hypothetical protein